MSARDELAEWGMMAAQAIPEAAVESAAHVFVSMSYGAQKPTETELRIVRSALEAAAPHMLSHEREQTRLAHLDAMVNRETKQAELAVAWNEGARAGEDNVWAGERQPTQNPYATSRGSDDET